MEFSRALVVRDAGDAAIRRYRSMRRPWRDGRSSNRALYELPEAYREDALFNRYFTGVPEEQWTAKEIGSGADSAHWMYKELGDNYSRVVSRFRDYPNVRVIQGQVPDNLDQVDTNAVAALFLDMNCAYPETAAMRCFWQRIVPGGIIFSDDYGHGTDGSGFFQQKVAFDDFAASVGLEVLCLPTGQALIVKPSKT